MQGHTKAKPAEESERLFRLLGDFGDYELVLAGVHENVVAQVLDPLLLTLELSCIGSGL